MCHRTADEIERDLLAADLALALEDLSPEARAYGLQRSARLNIELKAARGREIAKRSRRRGL
jgi:hypothetical protein